MATSSTRALLKRVEEIERRLEDEMARKPLQVAVRVRFVQPNGTLARECRRISAAEPILGVPVDRLAHGGGGAMEEEEACTQ
jgi:hypothetical protein